MDTEITKNPLPDVATENLLEEFPPLDWVGMSGIEIPVQIQTAQGTFRQVAKVNVSVSLDKSKSRGIHMSRLYLAAQDLLSKNALSIATLSKLLDLFLESHHDVSTSAQVEVNCEWPVLRPALLSSLESWRTYPVKMLGESVSGVKKFTLETSVSYSSTCPASAALSRQISQESFRENFESSKLEFNEIVAWLGTSAGMPATPHAQRSLAKVRVETQKMEPVDLIDLVEDALQTPVQGVVKREDEQEFARRNGANLMFCEDAARRLQKALSQSPGVLEYRVEVEHIESLHPHSAVAVVSSAQRCK